MTCEGVRANLVFYLQKKLPSELLLTIAQHLGSCVSCASELESLRQVERNLDRLEEINPSPYFDLRLNARLDELQNRPAKTWIDWWRVKLLDRYVLSFAALMLTTVGIWLGIRHEQYKELNSLEKVLEVQNRYLGTANQAGSAGEKTKLPNVKRNETRDTQPQNGLKVPADRDEEIPEGDRTLLENLDLLQNYEMLKSFDTTDGHETSAKRITE